MIALSRREAATAGTSCGTCRAEGHNEKDALQFILNVYYVDLKHLNM
jgi:hypothetical protein